MKTFLFIFVLIGLFLVSGCGDSTGNSGNGTLSLKITDAPFPVDWLDSALVTINKIEIRQKGEADSGKPYIVLSEEEFNINLLDLRNGITEDILEIDIPAGSYDLVRLYVKSARVKFKDGNESTLTVPSGAQTGIKVFISPDIQVTGGLTSELLLDFDLGKSFHFTGNPQTPEEVKGVKFKPVVRAVNVSVAGRISGNVSDTSGTVVANAQVWISRDTVITSTYSDISGAYQIIGMEAGLYDISAGKMGYDSLTVNDIEVVAGNLTNQNFVLTPKSGE